MGTRERYTPGTFCWAELGTGDPEAATGFYTGLFGWEAVDMAVQDGGDATTFQLAGCAVCALHRDGPAGWLSYVSVDDVDATTKRAIEAGATAVQEPLDVYAAARTAVLEDPTGALVGVWEPRRHIGATLVNDPGAMCLNQLNTSDPDAAVAFYTGVFGWEFSFVGNEAQSYWGITNAGGLNGGLMPLPPGMGRPHWLVYFTTADIDGSAGRAGDLGGTVVVPPMEVPGGRIAVALDPQRAVFGLLEGRTDP